MSVTTLLADPEAIRLNCIQPSSNTITLVVKTKGTQAMCPHCQRISLRTHSRYIRRVADLPWQGVAVKLELHTRRIRCLNSHGVDDLLHARESFGNLKGAPLFPYECGLNFSHHFIKENCFVHNLERLFRV